jgi:hypothetical protein
VASLQQLAAAGLPCGGLASGREAPYFPRRINTAGAAAVELISKLGIMFLLGVFALASLFVASGGHGFQYWSGLGFFVVCVLLIFYAVHQMTGDQRRHSDGH